VHGAVRDPQVPRVQIEAGNVSDGFLGSLFQRRREGFGSSGYQSARAEQEPLGLYRGSTAGWFVDAQVRGQELVQVPRKG